MVSILPAERTPFDVIGRDVGQALQGVLPQAVQQMTQRKLGMDALKQAEIDIANANGNPYKIAMAYAKAGAMNPTLERALGPLMQTALSGAKVNRAFPAGTPQSVTGGTAATAPAIAGGQSQQIGQEAPPYVGAPEAKPSGFLTPSPFNILTADEINSESERYANAVQDPNGFATRQAQLLNQNQIATQQREALEDAALKSGITPKELPRFMQVGGKYDPRNPSQWLQNASRAYQEVKNNDDKLQRAFIPGLGSALLGRNRDEKLKNLVPTVQDQVRLGLKEDTKNFLADQYLSPTEISEQIYPLKPDTLKALDKLPKGFFPKMEENLEKRRKAELAPTPFLSYEEAKEKAPKELQQMQDRLSKFFLENVKPDTSLLGLRHRLWDEKDYDWRQIGPAIRQAQQQGLKLSPDQSTELTDIETQPPIQSLPDIFQDWDRIVQFFRGAK